MLKIVLHGLADSVRPHPLPALRGAFRGELPSVVLSLPEVENVHAISVGKVVGMTDALDDIRPAADIDTRNPSPRILAFAITNMQPGADRAPVGLPLGFNFSRASRLSKMLSRIRRAIGGKPPFCPTLSNIQGETGVNNLVRRYTQSAFSKDTVRGA
jgi:hypothetical protein